MSLARTTGAAIVLALLVAPLGAQSFPLPGIFSQVEVVADAAALAAITCSSTEQTNQQRIQLDTVTTYACIDTGGGYAWTAVATAGGAGGDIDDVGDCSTGACFTAAGTGNALSFEGALADANDGSLTATVTAARTWTLPDETGTIATTGSIATGYAPLASPAMTGDPTVPTAAGADADTSAASTAFVGAEVTTHAGVATAHHTATVDTGPSPDCAGTTVYQDGEGNCDTITAVSGTTGSVFFAAAGGEATEDNANLFFDDTADALGVGTATPGQELEVVGSDWQLRLTSGSGYMDIAADLNGLGKILPSGLDFILYSRLNIQDANGLLLNGRELLRPALGNTWGQWGRAPEITDNIIYSGGVEKLRVNATAVESMDCKNFGKLSTAPSGEACDKYYDDGPNEWCCHNGTNWFECDDNATSCS